MEAAGVSSAHARGGMEFDGNLNAIFGMGVVRVGK